MTDTITVSSRFNGPQGSGNGGYASGLVATLLDGSAAVSLRSPVPLDTALAVRRGDEGVQVLNGETLVAEGQPGESVDPAVPAIVTIAEAERASERYRSPAEGLFSQCFVCGPSREDSFHVFSGEIDDSMVAATWTPAEWTADGNGTVRPEFVWAVLDCPTYWATHIGQEMSMSFLVRQCVTVHAPVLLGRETVAIAWPIEAEGRKRSAGAALLSEHGDVLATGRALMVEARAEPS
ncbi:MAG: hypothetical protein R2725_04370 [Solirubrobacterales bacterium]